MRVTVLALAIALCAASAFAQSVNLTYAPTVGDPVGYEMKMQGQIDVPQMQGLTFEATEAHTVQVLEVADGRAAIELKLGAAEVWIGPQQIPGGGEGEAAQYAVDASGIMDEVFQKLPATVSQGADGVALLAFSLRDLALPAKEVAVGDTWEVTRQDSPSLTELPEGVELTGTATWKGKLVSADETAIVVEVEFDIQDSAQGQAEMGGHLTGTSKLTLDPETRGLVTAEATINYEAQLGPGTRILVHDTTVTITRAQ